MFKKEKRNSEVLSTIGYISFWIGFPVITGFAMVEGNEIAQTIAFILGVFVIVCVGALSCGLLDCLLKVDNEIVENYSYDDYDYDDFGW